MTNIGPWGALGHLLGLQDALQDVRGDEGAERGHDCEGLCEALDPGLRPRCVLRPAGTLFAARESSPRAVVLSLSHCFLPMWGGWDV